jgi:hypothetical protein
VFQTLCNLSGGSCDLPFTLECIVEVGVNAATGSGSNFVWSIDTVGSHGYIQVKNPGGGDVMLWQVTGSQTFGVSASGIPVMLDYEFDGTSESYYYINGVLAVYATQTPQMTASSLSFFGWDGTTAGNFWSGRMQGCSTYNTMLTPTDIALHYKATGLP